VAIAPTARSLNPIKKAPGLGCRTLSTSHAKTLLGPLELRCIGASRNTSVKVLGLSALTCEKDAAFFSIWMHAFAINIQQC
jgi:hypothetical protein